MVKPDATLAKIKVSTIQPLGEKPMWCLEFAFDARCEDSAIVCFDQGCTREFLAKCMRTWADYVEGKDG